MKLTKVKIFNFRSFCNEETIDLEELTAIIGSNNSGKTTLLQALLKLFGETSGEREILKSDFHVPNNPPPRTWNGNYLHIDVTIELPDDVYLPSSFQTFEGDGKTKSIRIRKVAQKRDGNNPEGIIESKVYCVSPSSDDPSGYAMTEISKDYLSVIKVIYIPALRNPNEQLKMISGTLLWRFINRINFKDQFKKDISNQIRGINKIIDKQEGMSKLKEIIRKEWNNYHNESKYSNVNLTINPNNIEDILEKIEANFSPIGGVKSYSVDTLGDGLRSIFYLSLVGSLLKIEEDILKETSADPLLSDDETTFSNKPPSLTLIAVEEPENHVAPHLLGKIVNNLREISEGKNTQVILSSHSASIIKRIEPIEIRHFRKSKKMGETTIKKIYLPDKELDEYKYVKEAIKAYPEIYFSSLVILGEGDSEEIIIPRVLEVCGVDIHTHEISIVPLGGRHVNHFWKLLTQLGIPFITLLDLDLERHGGGWGRIKYVIEQLIKNGADEQTLFNLNPDQLLDKSKMSNMHKWDLDVESTKYEVLEQWVNLLEAKNVFFSKPLDIDFLMIKVFKANYIATLSDNEGPRIKIKETNKKISEMEDGEFSSKLYKDRIAHDVGCTLKDKNKTGKHYSDPEKELMIWYNYFFLNRGKPTTHILALNNLEEKEFEEKLPKVFIRMESAIQDIVIKGERSE
ncbi:ATP-dependent endonuclease [Bacillus cereus]|nr:ATP-dependent endonuclease [Bacillus cereus]